MGSLKTFVEVTTAGLIASFLSAGVDSAVSALASVSPLTGLIATSIGILLIAKDIADIYEAGAMGLAAVPAFLFQFMPLDWVVYTWAALVIVAALFERIVEAVKSWF
jgi:hypothetical protein